MASRTGGFLCRCCCRSLLGLDALDGLTLGLDLRGTVRFVVGGAHQRRVDIAGEIAVFHLIPVAHLLHQGAEAAVEQDVGHFSVLIRRASQVRSGTLDNCVVKNLFRRNRGSGVHQVAADIAAGAVAELHLIPAILDAGDGDDVILADALQGLTFLVGFRADIGAGKNQAIAQIRVAGIGNCHVFLADKAGDAVAADTIPVTFLGEHQHAVVLSRHGQDLRILGGVFPDIHAQNLHGSETHGRAGDIAADHHRGVRLVHHLAGQIGLCDRSCRQGCGSAEHCGCQENTHHSRAA